MRNRTSGWLPHRVFIHETGLLPVCRIYKHVHFIGSNGNPLLGWLQLSWYGLGAGSYRTNAWPDYRRGNNVCQNIFIHHLLYVGALDHPAFPLRSTNGPGLEGVDTFGYSEYCVNSSV